MSLMSWILILIVVGFIVGYLLVWKIFRSKFELSNEDWLNKNNRLELSKKKQKKQIKRLETHLLASHKKISILENDKATLLTASKAHSIQFKDIIAELTKKKRHLTAINTEISQSNDTLREEAERLREDGTQALKLEKNHTRVLQDLANFKEIKREEIEAIRTETQQIISDYETQATSFSSQLVEKDKKIKQLNQVNTDLETDNKVLETDLVTTTNQFRSLSENFDEFKLESKDNENQARVMLEDARSKLAQLKMKLSQTTPATLTKPEIIRNQSPEKNNTQRNKPSLRLLKSDKKVTDDLKIIKGIGPKIQEQLNKNGIFNFQQLAELTEKDIERINSKLNFKGRIQRDDWVGQAKSLATNAAESKKID